MATMLLVNNLAIIFYTIFSYTFLLRYASNKPLNKLLFGLIWSLAVWGSMINTYNIKPGVFFDSRSVILVLCGMFGGPITIIIPTITAIVYRTILGGIGIVPGNITIIGSVIAGLAFYYWNKRSNTTPGFFQFYLTGLAAHLVYFFAALYLPWELASTVMSNMVLPVLIIYPIVTAIISVFMINQERLFNSEQQLISSQQQLQAANQQYIAANQQLSASELQLKATNQQLTASEHELRASEEQYRELVENVNSVILKMDSNGIITYINSYSLTLFGYSMEELIGSNVLDTIVPDTDSTGKPLSEHIESIVTNPQKYLIVENENICKNGKRLWMRWHNKAIYNNNDEITGLFCVGTNCSEKKMAELLIEQYNKSMEKEVTQRTKELSEKNSQLENEIENRIKAEQELKNAHSQMVQAEKMVSIGRLASGIAHELNNPLGAIGSTNTTLEQNFKNLGKYCKAIYAEFKPFDTQVEDIVEQIINIEPPLLSSREKRNLKCRIAERLADNNIKSPEDTANFIINIGLQDKYEKYIQLLDSDQSAQICQFLEWISNIIQGLKVIDSAVKQSSRIAYALREYARDNTSKQMELSDIRHTIETAVILYGNKIKHGIDLNLNFNDTPQTLCFPNELIQVWANIIHNADQAMEGHGNLQIDLFTENNNIIARFTDSGCGISPEIQAKIFEPLFTTKPAGLGTGLGLDISKRIITRHDGTITVNSTPNQGSTFTITLPITLPTAQEFPEVHRDS